MAENIGAILKAVFAGKVVVILDSDQSCDGLKMDILVVSEKFNSVSLLDRQRMVHAALKEEKIHSLTMKTVTEEEYQKKKNSYRVEFQ